jgi:ABC-2 type transport system permease protein
MNKTLFFTSLKANWKLWLGIFFVLMLYQTIIFGMYDPESTAGMAAMLETLPPGLVAAFNFDGLSTDLTNFIGTYLYGFIFLIFPLLYIVPVANNLVAKHVDRGSMVYLLSTPNTRKKIAVTQASFLGISTVVLLLISILIGMLIANLMFPGELKLVDYLLLNLVTISVHLVLAGIAFLASCFFNESRSAITVSLSISLAFLIFQMLSGVSDKLDVLKYLTIFSLIDPAKIFNDHAFAGWSSLMLVTAAFLLMWTSVVVFDKKSMNI